MAGIPCKAALDRGVICDDQGIMKVLWIENSYLDILKLFYQWGGLGPAIFCLSKGMFPLC